MNEQQIRRAHDSELLARLDDLRKSAESLDANGSRIEPSEAEREERAELVAELQNRGYRQIS